MYLDCMTNRLFSLNNFMDSALKYFLKKYYSHVILFIKLASSAPNLWTSFEMQIMVIS